MRIWKQVVMPAATVLMPADAKIVHVGCDPESDKPAFWFAFGFEPDGLRPRVERRFRIFGTGHETGGVYVGTAIYPPFVWHLFEVTDCPGAR